jgi:hypothetical protein
MVATAELVGTDDLDAIDDLHDAIDLGDDLLCQLLLMEGMTEQ